MTEELHHPDSQPKHPDVRTEPTDARFGWVFALLAAAIPLGIVIHLTIFGFFRGYGAHQDEANRSHFPLAPYPNTSLPPEPRLEQIDRLNKGMAANAAEWERVKLEILHSYGPTGVDGIIHIPIDRAIDFIVAKNVLQVRPAPPDQRPRSDGLVDAGEPNSGRLFRGEKK